MGKLLYEGIIQLESFESFIRNKNVIIIPVPLHPQREKRRGYNQAELLGRELSIRLNIKIAPRMLERSVKTKPQFELKKEERGKNIFGAFSVNLKFQKTLKGRRIILVDDISTTGSTLRECAKILKKSGAEKVLGITLAHEEG